MSNIQGMDELMKQLSSIKGIKQHTEALLAGALVIEKYAKEDAPVDTGFLRSSISSARTADGAEVRVDAEYAYYQEFGSSRNKAQPYIRPAIDENQEEIVRVVAEQIDRDIKKLGG